MTFAELAELTGEPLREVQFDLDQESLDLLMTFHEFKDCNPSTERLSMVKPIYGLKDAPRAWQRKPDSILQSFGLRPLVADEQVYTLHRSSKLVCIFSTRVDNLKAMDLLAHIEKAASKLKQEIGRAHV